MKPSGSELAALWAHHHGELRDPHQVIVQWQQAAATDPDLLRFRVRGRFWEALEATGQTLVVTREYEHIVVALHAARGRPRVSYLRVPHPSGLAVDRRRRRLLLASTRNPNMIVDLVPARRFLKSAGTQAARELGSALLPVSCRYLPGGLYLHDLAVIGGRLFGNAVAMNAVVELPPEGGFRPAWWPECIDGPRGPRFDRNYLQLNSIAAGRTLKESYFSASAATPSARRPGHRNFAVEGRGVLFWGKTRAVVATGLTRPHSARFGGRTLWVANSGHGELGRIVDGRFHPLLRLPGWTRGLCIHRGVAFVGTSRVIPRFRAYAPGLHPDRCESGVHAVELKTGRIVGSLVWPRGNQIFAVELTGAVHTIGFPFRVGGPTAPAKIREFFFKATAG